MNDLREKIEQLKDADPDIRSEAAGKLGRMRDLRRLRASLKLSGIQRQAFEGGP